MSQPPELIVMFTPPGIRKYLRGFNPVERNSGLCHPCFDSHTCFGCVSFHPKEERNIVTW